MQKDKFRRATTTPLKEEKHEKLPAIQPPPDRTGKHRRAVFARSGSTVKEEGRDAGINHKAETLPFLPEQEEEVDPRKELVEEHPLFDGISEKFREEIMMNLKPFHVKPIGHEVKTEYAREMFESSLMRPRARTILSQGKPPQDLNGMLLVHPDDFHVFERVYNNVALGDAEGLPGVAGQEVALGITFNSPFTVRLSSEPRNGFFFIHTDILEILLDRHRADRVKLKETVYQAAQEFLRSWFMKNHTKVYVKLFANLDDDFKYALLNQVQIQFFKADEKICKEGDVGDSCIFVYTGEADIYCKHAFVGRMSQLPGTKAWESWWGALEVGGSCLERVASVRAYTDCVVWELSAKAMRDLWLLFPYECSFFDKVAMKHLQLLYPFTDRVSEINMFESCSADFTRVIRGLMVQKVYCRDEIVMQEGDTGDEMYVLCVGKCSVFRGYNTEPLSHLHPGSCFGGLAVLNITRRRTATIKADCVCDLRALTRAALLEALAQYPGDKEKVREMVEAHSQSRQATASALQRAGASEGSFSTQFLTILLDNMHEQPFLPKQVVLEQGKESILTILLHGMVDVEVSGVHIANVVAPAIFGERGILEPGSLSSATVRSCTVAECMILPPTSAAVPIIRARLPEDIARLTRMLEKKMALTRTQLASTEDLTNAADQQDKGLFGACSAAFLAKLGNYFERRVYLPDQKIIMEGEEPRYGVMLHQGTAVVESQGVLIAECGPGEFLGEVAILGLSKTSSATVRAQTKIVAYTVEAHSMQEVLDEFPEERVRLREIMDKRAQNQAKNAPQSSKLLSTKSKSVNKFLKVVSARRASQEPSEDLSPPKVDFETIQEQPKRALPGPLEGREWVEQRREKLIQAPKVRWRRMHKGGAVLEPLPATQGVRLPGNTTMAAFSKQRLRKAKSLYGKMVWQELLPKKTMMITNGKEGDLEEDAKELEAVLDAAEEGEELWSTEPPEVRGKSVLVNLPEELLEPVPMASMHDVAKFAAALAKHAKESKEEKAKAQAEAVPAAPRHGLQEPEAGRRRSSLQVPSERTVSVGTDVEEETIVATMIQGLLSEAH
ncbi:unnamed protein product [Durusdinium trenchii]|uniref:Cyclic nucleotide-binding domain-containing protein n=1 Tax=Durusdinium trenchii TaxID=1381693 RepID=A0ABP0RG58_9DINO